GNFALEAFAEKEYELEVVHPLYETQSITLSSEANDYSLDPIVLTLDTPKPGNVVALNNNGVAQGKWRTAAGHCNETMLGWGSFATAGGSWGNGSDPFIAGIRFETSDLQTQLTPGAELTHVRAYFANNAEVIIKVFTGENAAELIHSQPASIPAED